MFKECDVNKSGHVERGEFKPLISGYFSSKGIKPTKEDYDVYFSKLDLNDDKKISFDEFDIFVRMVFETEYLPSIEKEFTRRGIEPTR